MYLINALEERLVEYTRTTVQRTVYLENRVQYRASAYARPRAHIYGKLSNSPRNSTRFVYIGDRCFGRLFREEELHLQFLITTRARKGDVLMRILGKTSGRNPNEFCHARMPRENISLYGLSCSFSPSSSLHKRDRELTREGRRRSRGYKCRRNLVDRAR